MRELKLIKNFLVVFLVLFTLNFVSSAHYISGYVNNAVDGENANDHTILLYKYSNGVLDNLTDIIGVNGKSFTSNVYLIDCELLNNPCQIGDILTLKIIESGDNYVSRLKNVTVTGAGYDVVSNITLNSPPNIFVNNLVSITNNQTFVVNCTYNDLDSDSGFVQLWSNFYGSWSLVDSKPSSSEVLFSETLSEGNYIYSCFANDTLVETKGENKTITIDLTAPTINTINLNETFFCGNTSLRVTCNTTDLNGIKEVLIEANKPSGKMNYSSILFNGNYYFDLIVNEVGNWSFTCYSKDNANNTNSLGTINYFAYSGYPELTIKEGDLIFSKLNPIEGEEVTISATIRNEGCVDSGNFLVSFFQNSPLGNFIEDKTISLLAFSNSIVDVFYTSEIGKNNIFVVLDNSSSILEYNKSNNELNNSFNVLMWQEFYGNISAVKILSNSFVEFASWDNDTNLEGNVFMSDSESEIDWLNLFPLGKTKTGSDSSNDFSEVDSLLGTTDFVDSFSISYSTPVLDNLTVHKRILEDVSFINSTNNENFETGVLWDGSDDSNGEFDSSEKEDLVFVSKINKGTEGEYGTYDYEIRIPAKLREYHSENTQEVYFYYDLI